jgi:hypothetical protein
MFGACSVNVERRDVYRILVGKPEGKRPLVSPLHRWKNNIKMDLQELGRGRFDLIELAQDRERWRALMNAVMYLGVP